MVVRPRIVGFASARSRKGSNPIKSAKGPAGREETDDGKVEETRAGVALVSEFGEVAAEAAFAVKARREGVELPKDCTKPDVAVSLERSCEPELHGFESSSSFVAAKTESRASRRRPAAQPVYRKGGSCSSEGVDYLTVFQLESCPLLDLCDAIIQIGIGQLAPGSI